MVMRLWPIYFVSCFQGSSNVQNIQNKVSISELYIWSWQRKSSVDGSRSGLRRVSGNSVIASDYRCCVKLEESGRHLIVYLLGIHIGRDSVCCFSLLWNGRALILSYKCQNPPRDTKTVDDPVLSNYFLNRSRPEMYSNVTVTWVCT